MELPQGYTVGHFPSWSQGRSFLFAHFFKNRIIAV
jgi:hypothetical protein